jgi:hypothetical protein
MAGKLTLVVEGNDDQHVLWALLKHHNFKPEFKIEVNEGIEQLLKGLPVRLSLRNYERLGVVVDADLDITARWNGLKRILTDAGYSGLPDVPDPAGTVVEHADGTRVGLWLMPDNVLPGMLEDYVALLIPEGDTLIGRAKHCLDEVPVAERRFLENHYTKALIHTWLAWQAKPGTPLGQAITNRSLDPESPHVAGFLQWLTRLFA